MKDLLKYEDLLTIATQLNGDVEVNKNGLTLHYAIDPLNHKKLDETLYYKSNPNGTDFKHREIIEVTIGGLNMKLIKKNS
jgi:hypothetical protein